MTLSHSPLSQRFCGFRLAVICSLLAPFSPGAIADSFPTNSGDITINPQIHASVEIEFGGLVIQVDPWGRNGVDGFKAADLILITDNSGHHLDATAIDQLSTSQTSVVSAANAVDQIPHALVLANGESARVAGITIEAVAAYDIIQAAPEHPRGEANGYVISLGDKRLYIAGVTECVEEVRALGDIDVAFLPMNIPPGRMVPAAAAECARALNPAVVYTYHYDQDYARRANNPEYGGSLLPGGISVAESLELFAQALAGTDIEYRRGNWYPPLR